MIRQYQPLTLDQITSKPKEQEEIKNYIENNPLTLDSGYLDIVADCTNSAFPHYYVTMGELIDSLDDEAVDQREIDPIKVRQIFLGKSTSDGTAFIRCGKLLVQIHIGYFPGDDVDENGNVLPNEDGIFNITSGRHRTVFILCYAALSGVDINSERFRSLKVAVTPGIYDLMVVLAANQSRTVQANEKMSIALQAANHDPHDIGSIIAALRGSDDSGKVKGVTLNNVAGMVFLNMNQLVLQAAANDPTIVVDKVVSRLTSTTLMKIGSAFLTNVKRNLGAEATKGVKNDKYLIELLKEGFKHLSKAIEAALPSFKKTANGGTNYALNAALIGQTLANIISKAVKKGEIKLPKVVDEKKKTKARSKKVKPIDEQAQPVADSGDNDYLDDEEYGDLEINGDDELDDEF